MRIDILTAFPGVFEGPLSESIVGRACRRNMVDVYVHDLRAFTTDRHKTIDDYAYGGAPGMVLKPEPIFSGVAYIRRQVCHEARTLTVLLSAGGRPFAQDTAKEFVELDQLILICGHYKGVDERVVIGLGAVEFSVGDFVVTGGEAPALMISDAVIRLIPGVLGDLMSATTDSHVDGLLGSAVYTRPAIYEDWQVPEALTMGHHDRIARWQREDALCKTLERRPELLENAELTQDDLRFLNTLKLNKNR